MIELYDIQRLQPRRDRSALLGLLALLLLACGLSGYGWSLQSRLAVAEAQRSTLQQRLAAAQARPAPTPALLIDLQRELARLEGEARAELSGAPAAGPAPSQWMQRLADLGNTELSLSKIEVDRSGTVQVEGLASSPQAVSRLLQQWDQGQAATGPAPARAIDLRQDPGAAPLLRFSLRAAAAVDKDRT